MIAFGANMDLLLDLAPQVLSRLASHSSGSTGKPKGVVHGHASVASRALQRSSAMNTDSNTHALQFGAYTFIISTFEIFTTLIFGGYLCMPSEYDGHTDVRLVIRSCKVNWAILIPILHAASTPRTFWRARSLRE